MKLTEVSFDLMEPPHSPVSVLSPETWPFNAEWLPQATYLVGGNVRDALLGRQAEYLDLDFVLPQGAVKTAKRIASYYQAGFVLLDADRQIARVVFDRATVDFAEQVGGCLDEDLHRRDFTVNAIAYNPHSKQLLDPLHGYADVQRRVIRMIAPENLKDDPLRLLRAYRQAAQLGFALDPATRTTIRHLADLLQFIAAERIQSELSYLLSTAKGTAFLRLAVQDGLLKHWLPSATPASLARVAGVDEAAVALAHRWSAFEMELLGWVRDQQKASGTGRSWLKIAKLTSLVAAEPEVAEQQLWRLKYSRMEIQAVLAVLKALPQVQPEAIDSLSAREQYMLFRGIGAAFPALAVLAVASGTPLKAIAPLMERFLTPNDPIAHPASLLTGRDLMQHLGLPAGPQIGQLLETIQLARAEGQLDTREEALEFAKALMQP